MDGNLHVVFEIADRDAEGWMDDEMLKVVYSALLDAWTRNTIGNLRVYAPDGTELVNYQPDRQPAPIHSGPSIVWGPAPRTSAA